MLKDLFKLLKELFTFDKTPDKAIREIIKPVPAKSSRKLEDAVPELQVAFRLIRMYYREYFPLHTLRITRSYRSIKEQQSLYAQGRTTAGVVVTYVDGVQKKGKHNYYPSKAIDIAVENGTTGEILWDVKYYKPFVKLAVRVSKELGRKITSGGSWKKLKDYPHLQV